MALNVRRIVRHIAPALLLAAVCTGASAQAYPTADIHFVTGFPPGSGADVITRYFAEKTAPARRHATSSSKTRSAPPGRSRSNTWPARSPTATRSCSTPAARTAASMHLMKTPPVDVLKAFQIAATINRQAFMLVVDAKSPYKPSPN